MLETIFGRTPIVKVIDFFLQHRDYDYSKKEIMKYAGISRGTFYSDEVLGVLLKFNLITETREVGNSKLYKLNLENPIVQKLDELDNEISFMVNLELAKEEIGREAVKEEFAKEKWKNNIEFIEILLQDIKNYLTTYHKKKEIRYSSYFPKKKKEISYKKR